MILCSKWWWWRWSSRLLPLIFTATWLFGLAIGNNCKFPSILRSSFIVDLVIPDFDPSCRNVTAQVGRYAKRFEDSILHKQIVLTWPPPPSSSSSSSTTAGLTLGVCSGTYFRPEGRLVQHALDEGVVSCATLRGSNVFYFLLH